MFLKMKSQTKMIPMIPKYLSMSMEENQMKLHLKDFKALLHSINNLWPKTA